jgi:hypothetical protein
LAVQSHAGADLGVDAFPPSPVIPSFFRSFEGTLEKIQLLPLTADDSFQAGDFGLKRFDPAVPPSAMHTQFSGQLVTLLPSFIRRTARSCVRSSCTGLRGAVTQCVITGLDASRPSTN